jgi:N-methylhydantoinase A
MAEDAGPVAYRLGCDIGGTFTDLILLGSDGSVRVRKVLSTPPQFSEAVIAGLRSLLTEDGIPTRRVEAVLHGTTVAANAILEERGARAGLVTTAGFRDVLEIGRMRRPYLYDVSWSKPRPLVPRRRRLELGLRIDPQGAVVEPLCDQEVDELALEFRRQQVESVAVCLVNSYAAPDLERRVAARLARTLPHVTASVDVSPEIKEYERTSTAVVNAYVQPTVATYVEHLAGELRAMDVPGPLLVMQSSGGLLEAPAARARPVYLLESGPAAGVIGAAYLGGILGIGNAIAFDMGGTTAKASLIEDGRPFEAPEYEAGGGMNARHGLSSGAGYVVRTPSIDIAEVGAGGGSICWVDSGGSPRVGPQSAGALPGPACYGRGGDRPTLTDAQVVLGHLSGESLAGGAQSIDAERAAEVLHPFAKQLGLSVLEAAHGVCTIAIDAMSRAVKAVSSQRGRDPRDFVLIAFGGAGPAYAVEMARTLGMRRVLVPPHPGLFCSMGLLAGDLQYNDVRTYVGEPGDHLEVARVVEEMESGLAATLERDGHRPGTARLVRFADVHYRGQSSELRIGLPAGPLHAEDLKRLRREFDDEHERTYGHRGEGQAIELTALRVRATLPAPARDRAVLFEGPAGGGRRGAGGDHQAYFGGEYGRTRTPIVDRQDLDRRPEPGPLIVQDMDATTIVPPGASAARDELGNILIEVA